LKVLSLQDRPIGLYEAFKYWLKLGFISFGGPAGQIAIMHHDLVEQKRWISEKRFLHALNYCMLLPGPEAQQLSIYIGWLMHGKWGGLVAGVLFVLPAFFILCLLGFVYMAFGHVPAISAMLYGIKPAVVAIVLFAAYRIANKTLKNPLLWGIAALAFLAIFAFKLPFPLIILSAALLGVLGHRFAPNAFHASNGHTANTNSHEAPSLIDDHTPTPPHAQFTWVKFWRTGIIGLLIWLGAILPLGIYLGWQHLYTQLSWFFTKAALLTFGGAYAVLPYVYQGAVEHYHWLTATQMMDSLALGETTPGPLIMVNTFVGFLTGWQTTVGGLNVALLCASIVTFFTFLPSFVMIFLGAPFIESTRGNLSLGAPLTAISAALVGVILNLALFFGYHVVWPHGLQANIDRLAGVMSILALIALIRFKVGVITVIMTCALFGLLARILS
jgi:chromate transporter